jgi:PAS domain S-box-containing protein
MDKTSIQVLLIEDNPADVVFIREAIARDGLTVFQITNTERLGTAIGLLKAGHFDLILLDLGLPDSFGLNTFTRLNHARPDIPIVILSGLTDESFALQAVQAGAQDYLVKGAAGWDLIARTSRYAMERHQNQTALRESEERYRQILNSMLEGCQIISFDWRYLYLNETAVQQSHFTSAKIVGRTMMEVYPGIESTPLFSTLRDCMENRASKRLENRFVYPDGGVGWFELSIQPASQGLFILASDISERKLAEQALLKSQSRLNTIVDSAMDAIISADEDMRIIIFNDAAEYMFGCRAADALGKPLNTFIPTRYQIHHRQRMSAMDGRNDIQVGKVFSVSAKRVTGEEFPAEATISQVETDEGRIYTAILRDVTERRQSEAKIQESEAQYRYLFENNPHPMWAYDLETLAFLAVNDAAVNKYGFSRAEFLQMDITDIRPPEEIDRLKKHLSQPRPDLQFSSEWRHRLKDGALIDVDISSHLIQLAGRRAALVVAMDVTEHKRAEAELRESETRFRQLAENIHEVFWMIDLTEDKMVYVSPAFETIWGRTVDSVLENTREYLTYILPEDQPVMQAALAKQTQGEPTAVEYRISRPDGSIRWIWNRSFSIRDASGTVVRVAGVASDITSLKTAQQDLEILNRDLEQRVRQRTAEVEDLYNRAPAGYHSLDENGMIVRMNQTELDWLGYTRAELVGKKKLIELFTPQSQKIFGANFPKFMSQGWIKDLEFEIVRKDGSILPVLVNATAINDEQGKYIMSRSTVFDITERKRVEEALRSSKERLNFVLDKTPAMIFTASLAPNMPMTFISSSVTDILGFTPDQFLEDPEFWLSRIHPEDTAAGIEAYQTLMAQGYAVWENRVRRADGEYHWMSTGVSLLVDSHGKPDEIIGYSVDINEQKKAQEALRISEARLRQSRDELSSANAALEKAARMKDEFLASMSHELRTPLTGVLALSEALQLKTYGELTEKQMFALKNIESSGRHLLELINDILDLSKIEAGKLELQFASASLADICQASLQLVKGMAHQKKQTIGFRMEPASTTVYVDARRLKQMLVNLLSNAVKFTPPGGALGLEVKGFVVEEAIRLTVWDNGIGIKSEDLPALFKPFVQLDSSLARQQSGTGLGLSLVQRMAELHGGSIQVESALGIGSRFTIVLPWLPQDLKPSASPARDPAIIRHSLTVEDGELDAEHITRYLLKLGISNVVSPTASGAVELAAGSQPDVILLDLHLPDKSGLDVLAALKADPRTQSIPVVMVSAQDERKPAMQLGASGYLFKPFYWTDLRVELARVAAEARKVSTILTIAPRHAVPQVMLVDDNEVTLETVSDFLSANSLQVISARSGSEALRLAAEFRPDVILMDIQMPGMDGLETTRRLRAHPNPEVSHTAIIAVTALAMSGDRERCLEAGANEYLSKPVPLKKLLSCIQGFLPTGDLPK